MNKQRALVICLQMKEKLDAMITELRKDNPYHGYLDEKLKPIENDIKCVREEIDNDKNQL